MAESLDAASIELEGQPMIPIATAHTDTADTTSLHVPSLELIAAGDVVYNGIHPYLGESNAQTRLEWIDALDKLDALQPRAVVAGHKIPTTTTTRRTSPIPGSTCATSSASIRPPTPRARCSTR
jgi:hypothetical protein